MLLLYCCFSAVLLLFYCCFTALLPAKVETIMEREARICCCFTAALLLLYCGITAALLLLYCFTTSQSGDLHGARGDCAHVFVREVQYLVVEALLLLYFCFTSALLMHYARRLCARFRSRGPVPSRRI
jgi:hypothetical protein